MKRTYQPLSLLLMGLGITFFLYFAGRESYPYHHALQDILRKVYFVPIILAAFWYGVRGGLLAAFLVSLLYLPHVILSWGDGTTHNPDRVSEIALYLLVGWITGWMAQRRRETAQKLEASYRELKTQTEHRLAAEERLRQVDRLATLGELAARLAHEIGNPLGSIKGAAEILCDDYPEDSPKYEFAQILLKETQRLDARIRDFLELGRPRPLELVETDLNALLREASQFVALPCAQQEITIRFQLAEDLGPVLVDPHLMEQAVLNLLSNAVAAMPGGGTLTLSTSRSNAHQVQITIADTGQGIPADQVDKVFEPFFTTREGGTGLGLAIVRRIVEAHRGHISVETREGEGTRFTIQIPVPTPSEGGTP